MCVFSSAATNIVFKIRGYTANISARFSTNKSPIIAGQLNDLSIQNQKNFSVQAKLWKLFGQDGWQRRYDRFEQLWPNEEHLAEFVFCFRTGSFPRLKHDILTRKQSIYSDLLYGMVERTNAYTINIWIRYNKNKWLRNRNNININTNNITLHGIPSLLLSFMQEQNGNIMLIVTA